MTHFQRKVLPCEGCGTDVHFEATADVASEWATGLVSVWCSDCWKTRAVEPEPPRQIDALAAHGFRPPTVGVRIDSTGREVE